MSSEIETNVTPVPSGPYIVKNLKKLINIKGSIEVGETAASTGG